MNKKEEKTIALLVSTLAKLIQKEDYADITISELIEESGVSRSTFYSHFKKKDDVLNEVCDDIFHHVFSVHLQEEERHDFSHESVLDCRHIVLHLFYHVQEQREVLCPIFDSSAYSIFRKRLEPNVTSLMKIALGMKEFQVSNVPDDLALSIATSALVNFIRYFSFSKDASLTPERMTDYFFGLFAPRQN